LNSARSSSQRPWFLSGYNDKLVVGDEINGKVYFYSLFCNIQLKSESLNINNFNHLNISYDRSIKTFFQSYDKTLFCHLRQKNSIARRVNIKKITF
jgi:hypothetical protein